MGLYGEIGVWVERFFCRSPWQALALSWLISPMMMFILGLILESRVLPVWQNSKAFIPGDMFLGVALALAVSLIPDLPETGWWQSRWYIWGVVMVMAIFTLVMMFGADGPRYPLAARLSPTKLWHDIMCYFCWGTALVAVIVPVLVATPQSHFKIMICVCIGIYFIMAGVDAIWTPNLKLLHTRWNISWIWRWKWN